MSTLRYGRIGAGAMGRGHLKCLEAIDGVRLTAAADPSEESLAQLRETSSDEPPSCYHATGTSWPAATWMP